MNRDRSIEKKMGEVGGTVVTESGPRGQTRKKGDTYRRLARRFFSQKLPVIGLIIFTVIVLISFVGSWFYPYSFDVYTPDLSQPPSWAHPFGTNSTGYDTLSQVMRGSQRSIQIALFVAITATAFGSIVGATAGLLGGWVDSLIMRGVDLVLIFPAIAVAAFLAHQAVGTSVSWLLVGVVLALLAWPIVSRVVRSVALSIRELDYVAAAQLAGASSAWILRKHIIPNSFGPISVAVTVLTATAILAETSLSYLGFGVQAPDTSLGLLIQNAQSAVLTRPWVFYFPGAFIIAVAISISFIGDGLRYAFDPRQSRT